MDRAPLFNARVIPLERITIDRLPVDPDSPPPVSRDGIEVCELADVLVISRDVPVGVDNWAELGPLLQAAS